MAKEVQVKDQAALPAVSAAEWGTDMFVGKSDILLAKILPMQQMSQLVVDDKAKAGEFRDSLSGALLGSIAQPFEIIPFHVEKFWDIMEEDGEGNFKWARSEPLIENPADPKYNDNLPWQDKVDGIEIKRVRRMNFYVMIPSEIAAGTALPYILSFKSTSFREGKKMFTQMYMRNLRAKLPPPGYLFKIGGTKQKNDKGTFIVPNVELSRPATQAEMAECLTWFKMVKAGQAKVDESDVTGTTDADPEVQVADGTGAF